MRSKVILFAAAVLSTLAAAAAEVAAAPEVQGSATPASSPVAEQPAAVTAVPQQEPATPVAAAEAASASATAGVAARPETTSGEVAATQPTTLKVATVEPPADFHPPAGYRAVKSGLETVYCTSYTPIGSRMSQKVCMSREQVEELLRQQDEARRALRKGSGCAGACGGG